MIELSDRPIDPSALLARVAAPEAGAVVLFLGTVRAETDGRGTASLDYECYTEMAREKLVELHDAALENWSLARCAVVHRVGHLVVGEASVAVAVSSAHREAAFEAGRWLIDRIKQVVPIWKRENRADGSCQWIHPGLDTAAEGEG